MAKIGINSVTNANVYLDGANLLGRANEVTLPEPTQRMIEHRGLGMFGTIELPGGGLEAMEARFKWASFYPEVLRRTAARRAVQIQVRSSLETYTGQGLTDEVALVVTLGGIFKKNTLGVFKQHESVLPEDTMAVHYMKLVVNGESLLEVDVMNNIHKVADEDLLARFRTLIGG